MQDNFEKTSEDFIQCLDKITKILHIVVMVLIAISTLGIFSLLITKDQKASDQNVPEGKNLPIILSSTMGAQTACFKYHITSEERDMLASLCTLEAGNCSMECKRAVVSVIFNRLQSRKWRKDVNGDGKITLYDIVYYKNAFSPTSRIVNTIGTKESYEAVDYVTRYGSTLPPEVRYFRDSYDFSWKNYKNYTIIDNIYFGYFENWRQGVW